MIIENSIKINKLNEFATKKRVKSDDDIEIMKMITKFDIIKRISKKKFIRIKI